VNPGLQRALMVGTPIVAMAAVALGLRIGAGSAVRAAVVYGMPASNAGTGLAWQVVLLDEDRGVREPAAGADVEIVARSAGGDARWKGTTGEDGVAEVLLPVAGAAGLHLEVRSAGGVVAVGDVAPPPASPASDHGSAWARFARREGPVLLDVAILGQRVASGFPADIWVRASDETSGARLSGVTIEPEVDQSLTVAAPTVRTDTHGWAHITATPLGYGVPLILHARAADARTGVWAGALLVSPGASRLVMSDRYAPDEQAEITVIVPTVRTTAYVEIDDASGRAWGAVLPLSGGASSMPEGHVTAPKLAPGLYWAIAADDPAGSSELGAGTLVRPFFVAASDEAALRFGPDPSECTMPPDPRETPRAVGVCLALAHARAMPKAVVLDGFGMQRARDAERRARGLEIALGAIALAVLLEAALLIGAVRTARASVAVESEEGAPRRPGAGAGRLWGFAVAVLVGLLGFALLAAFLLRVG
jgi:hypothetical protein